MNVLLINSPIRLDAAPSCIPYGLATVASCLLENGIEVELYDINALRPAKAEILETLHSQTWDVIGISGLVTTYAFQRWLFAVLKALKPGVPLVSGGGLATANSDLLFATSPVDIAVIGEGEATMVELCRVLEQGGDLGRVAGIQYRSGERIIKNRPRENAPDLDAIPFPAWDLLPMEIYLKNPIWGDVAGNSSGFKKGVSVTRSMNIISSRGCPFSCHYCYHLFGRGSYRFRSVASVGAEIEALVKRYGVDFIGFVDDNMMASEKRLLEFCDLMEQKRYPLTWGCHGRVTSARPEILERMAAAGCVWIGYGIESGSPRILKEMNKKASVEQARAAIINTRKAGIFPNTTFIFGYPGESRATIQETIDFKRGLDLTCGSFFATPYPGTPLYNEIISKISKEKTYIESLGNATEFSINLTRFSDAELIALKADMDANRDVL